MVFQGKEKTRNEILLLLSQKLPQLPSERSRVRKGKAERANDPQGREEQFGKYKETLIAGAGRILLVL